MDLLEKDDDVVSFECNVPLKGVADDMYSTDFVITKRDGTAMVRECVWRFNVSKPSYTKLLDISRNYWLKNLRGLSSAVLSATTRNESSAIIHTRMRSSFINEDMKATSSNYFDGASGYNGYSGSASIMRGKW